MEEAERLCNRIAVLDSGRLIALDTPAGLVSRFPSHQQIRFRTEVPFDEGLLRDLTGVRAVRRNGAQVLVTGSANTLNELISTLARHGIVALDLRVEQASLDDAFIALTSGDAGPTVKTGRSSR